MTEEQARAEVASQWIGRSEQALASAASELNAGRLEFAVNRSYYACFYSASAVLLMMGHRFVKHSGLRAAVLSRFTPREQIGARSSL